MRTIISGASIFDGTGVPPWRGDVAIAGNRIDRMAQKINPAPGDCVIDGAGKTLMPGLVEAHAHLTWPSSIEKFYPDFALSPEELREATWRNARILLEHGFTSAYSAGALTDTIEVDLRKEIESGKVVGPRLVTSTIERAPSAEGGGANFVTEIDHGHGREAMAAFIAKCHADGIQSVKFQLSGEDALAPGTSEQILYVDEELAVACEAAERCGIWLNAHTHAAESIKLALRNGFRVLYHCEMADEEAIDMLVAAKDRVFLAPAIGVVVATLEAHAPPEFDMTAMKENATLVLARSKRLMPELKRRGVRILPGGDYGFPFNPNGTNARDLKHFVDLYGFTPAEALSAATQLGGQVMGRGHELGLVREGYLADLLLVDGDPTQDVSILEDASRIEMIMKDGRLYKSPAAVKGRVA